MRENYAFMHGAGRSIDHKSINDSEVGQKSLTKTIWPCHSLLELCTIPRNVYVLFRYCSQDHLVVISLRVNARNYDIVVQMYREQ